MATAAASRERVKNNAAARWVMAVSPYYWQLNDAAVDLFPYVLETAACSCFVLASRLDLAAAAA
jgi:hypothetical protein